MPKFRALAALCVLGTLSSIADACQCLCLPDEEGLAARVRSTADKADLVFVGTVEKIETVSVRIDDWALGEVVVKTSGAFVRIERLFKGAIGSHIWLLGYECCGTFESLPRAEKLLVYASGPDEVGYVNSLGCGSTKPVVGAEAEEAVLEQVFVPVAPN